MMNIKKILTAISDEECVLLYNHEIGKHAIADSDDFVEVVDGEECVMLQIGPETRAPVPTSDFSEVRIMSKAQYTFEQMMEMFGNE